MSITPTTAALSGPNYVNDGPNQVETTVAVYLLWYLLSLLNNTFILVLLHLSIF